MLIASNTGHQTNLFGTDLLQFKRNPYYQAFCGFTEFSCKLPCDSSELVHFRKRISDRFWFHCGDTLKSLNVAKWPTAACYHLLKTLARNGKIGWRA